MASDLYSTAPGDEREGREGAEERTIQRYADVPAELRARPQWVGYRLTLRRRREKPDELVKTPYSPSTGALASVSDPTTWAPFADAVAAVERRQYDGVGFVFTEDDPYTGIDLDHCRDVTTGELAPWASAIIAQLNSYTEVSPSGTGVHVLVRASVPEGGNKKAYESGAVELYDHSRYFTITGQRLPGTPEAIATRAAEVAQLHAQVFGAGWSGRDTPVGADGRYAPPTCGVTGLSDAEALARCRSDQDGERFRAVYDEGDLDAFDDDDSRADWYVWGKLVFYLGDDVARIIALAEAGAHFQRPDDPLKAEERAKKWRRPHPVYGTFQAWEIAVLLAGREPERVYGGVEDTSDIVFVDAPATGSSSAYERNERNEETLDADGRPHSSLASPAFPASTHYPDPPDPAVYYGLAGDLVAAIEPHTESDPVGVLAQFLTAFGNMAGRHAHFRVEADTHYPALFVTLVGETSRSRKGTGRGQVLARCAELDPLWAQEHVQTGLSSGEGIIHALRDTKENDAARAQEPLLSDKRLLVLQGEFGSVLKMLTREGNILSDIAREAWDGHPLGTLTKHAGERATQYHLSLIGHITKEELTRSLTATESANGFGNRFLWLCVRRTRLLPDGGDIASVDFREINRQLGAALLFAIQDQQIRRDAAARALWRSEYARLSSGHPGLLGALTARAEAQVMRLALLYALLDCSPVITEPHLRAALALWDYAERSVRFIFGDAVGDPIADTILSGLRAAYPHGLTRTAISDLFGRNARAEKLTPALLRLRAAGLARVTQEKTEKAAAGRPAEVWYAVQPADGGLGVKGDE